MLLKKKETLAEADNISTGCIGGQGASWMTLKWLGKRGEISSLAYLTTSQRSMNLFQFSA